MGEGAIGRIPALLDCWAQTDGSEHSGWAPAGVSRAEAAKGKVGLDEYKVRSTAGWYRHMTLTLSALVLLASVRAAP